MQIRLSDSIEVFGRCGNGEAEKTGKTGLEPQRILTKRKSKGKNVIFSLEVRLAYS